VFAPLPSGTNAVDFQGYATEAFSFEISVWTDTDFSARFNVIGQTVPEPSCLVLLLAAAGVDTFWWIVRAAEPRLARACTRIPFVQERGCPHPRERRRVRGRLADVGIRAPILPLSQAFSVIHVLRVADPRSGARLWEPQQA